MWPEAAGAKFLLKQRERQIFVTRCFVARTSLFTVIYDPRPAIICFPPHRRLHCSPNFFFLSIFKPPREKKFSTRASNAISQQYQQTLLPLPDVLPLNNNDKRPIELSKHEWRKNISYDIFFWSYYIRIIQTNCPSSCTSPTPPSFASTSLSLFDPPPNERGGKEGVGKKLKETINTIETKRIKRDCRFLEEEEEGEEGGRRRGRRKRLAGRWAEKPSSSIRSKLNSRDVVKRQLSSNGLCNGIKENTTRLKC